MRSLRTLRAIPLIAAVIAAAVLTVAGAVHATVVRRPDRPADRRGVVVWAEPLRTLAPGQARAALRTAGYDDRQVTHGVELSRIVYRTIGPDGHATTATGLLAVPVTATRTLSTVLFEHGTVSYRGDAPSSLPADLFASAPALSYAAAGYAAAAPDYLGLGLGPGPHPWFDVPSETSASIDFLRAARTVVAQGRHRLGRELLVTGFSQGASAALGVARSLPSVDRSFHVAAVAPVSGGYAFGRVELPALLDGRIPAPVAVPYVAYLLTAWKRLHHLYRSHAEVFRAPYDRRVETLFNSEVPGPDLMRGLPSTLDRLLTPAGRALLVHPRGAFAAALREADGVCRWRPTAPVRLYYARGDEQALTTNTTACSDAFASPVRTVDLGRPTYAGSRHLGSGVAGVTATLDWFGQVVPPAR